MKAVLQSLSELVAAANDVFYRLHPAADTIMGITDKALRRQGLPADAITVDCKKQDKKLVFLLHDEKPDTVCVAVGNHAGDIHSSQDYALLSLTEQQVVSLLQVHLL